jgi:hypothetical protein
MKDREAFEADGYFIEENIFSAAECEQILSIIQNSTLVAGRGGIRNLM